MDDSHEYFMEHLERICATDYSPTIDDLVRCRVRTTGIQELQFNYQGRQLHLIDVGGQRTERRKWIHCFEEVTMVLYVVALSEYDLVCEEDLTTNRMQESMRVFGDVIKQEVFAKVPFTIFYNKKDLFDRKIGRVPLKVCFPEYTGTTPDEAQAYIIRRFEEQNKTKDRQLYRYITCATDRRMVQVIFTTVFDTLFTSALKGAGFYSLG